MLEDYKFAALDTDTGLGMFEHPAIHEVIAASMFHSSAPTSNIGADERFADNFKSYPNGLIVFGATAVFAALSEWSTGVYVQAKFEGRIYETAFQDMLDIIKSITAGEEEHAIFERKRAGWYMDAWAQTPMSTVVQNSSNRSAIVMRNRLALRAAHAESAAEQLHGPEPEPDAA
ncbi:hypothetical protein AURDEDRAFT_113308 [Auricularia subglabra TFB-10046 SS5]|nr:hypothetical protein AURDEDRAFT_113308 [Auricularia subglabra TFB-10046 SS5]